MEVREHDGERGVEDDDQEYRFDHGDGGEAADALGALRHLEPLITADQRDHHREERRLQRPEPERPTEERALQLAEFLNPAIETEGLAR